MMTNPWARNLVRLLTELTCTVALLPGARAQDTYPTAALTMIVGWPPGGPSDNVARLIAAKMSTELGQSIVIDNRAGAGSNIGSDVAARARPDGYTIMLATVASHGLNSVLYSKLNFDPIKDFAPIGYITSSPSTLLVPADSPYKSLRDVIDAAKANPGKLNYGSGGVGSSQHLAGAIFKKNANLDIVHIPYKGIAQAVTDTIGGQVQVLPIAVPSVIQYLRAGSVKPLAVTSTKRVGSLPDVPTMAEAGVDALSFDSWFGLFAPASTPAQVVQKINQSVNEILNTPDAATTFASVGAETLSMSTQAFGELVRKDTARWGKVARESGATVE